MESFVLFSNIEMMMDPLYPITRWTGSCVFGIFITHRPWRHEVALIMGPWHMVAVQSYIRGTMSAASMTPLPPKDPATYQQTNAALFLRTSNITYQSRITALLLQRTIYSLPLPIYFVTVITYAFIIWFDEMLWNEKLKFSWYIFWIGAQLNIIIFQVQFNKMIKLHRSFIIGPKPDVNARVKFF